jgi:large subunit ribosomal protein L13
MTMEKTYVIKGKTTPNWILVDAKDQSLGRLSTQIARYILGKHKPTFTPGVDMGDEVVVINASLLRFTQKRLEDKKYYWHTGYPGGLKEMTLQTMLEKHPERIIRRAVWGMIPHTKLGRRLIKRLWVYPGSEHPHEAQKPQKMA